MRLGDRVSPSRFIFLANARAHRPDGASNEDVLWMIVSSNNRQLGRGAVGYASYAECRTAVERLRGCLGAVRTVVSPGGVTGQWVWRLDLDGVPVARSSRSYLRIRECDYNLARFLEAVPSAAVVEGIRRQPYDRRIVTPLPDLAGSRALPGDGLRRPLS